MLVEHLVVIFPEVLVITEEKKKENKTDLTFSALQQTRMSIANVVVQQ